MVGLLLWVALTTGSSAADSASARRTDIWSLALGSHAADLPEEAFIDYACGTDGGPPGKLIGGFTDFARCVPEENGLYEVDFRYDDEAEYRSLARGVIGQAEQTGGTKISVYPVIASALFDADGVLRGLRAINDTRVALRDRAAGYLLAQDVRVRFGIDGWTCLDLPPSTGEEPVNNLFVKQTCTKLAGDTLVATEAHLLRRRGETERDPITGRIQQGKFESTARIEIREAGTGVDDQNRPI